MHQLIAAGGGDAQHLSDYGCVEEQRQVIISFIDGCFQFDSPLKNGLVVKNILDFTAFVI